MQKTLVGSSPSLSGIGVENHVVLRHHIAILVFFAGITFTLVDLVYIPGLIPNSAPFYAGLLCCALLGLWLNKRKRYITSSVVLLVSVNLSILIFASSSKGVMLLFIPSAIGALVLIDQRHPVLRWGFLVLSYLLFALNYFFDLAILPAESQDKEFHSTVFFIAATSALVAIILIVHFFIQVNKQSKFLLQETNQRLQKLANELQQSQKRFELVIQGSRAGIYEWNIKSNTFYVSPEWKKILGFSEEDMQDFTIQHLADLTHPDDRERLEKGIYEHFATHEPFQNESRRRHKDGTYRWIFDSGLSTTDEHGNIETIVGSIIDITDRKHAELRMLDQNELLKKANHELDRFVYSASHDLRSPLSSVLGLLSIAEHTANPEEMRTYHTMMRERIKKLDSFVTEVLDYSRNNDQEIEKAPIALAALIGEIVEGLRFAEESSMITITHHVHEDLIIETDSTRLKIILNNLIGNSIKYHDPKKEKPFITINTELKDNHCTIGIADNGIGIDRKHQEKVFDMFYRATQQSKGSGLGLYITKEIVTKLGGTITLNSTPLEGTHLLVTLPVR